MCVIARRSLSRGTFFVYFSRSEGGIRKFVFDIRTDGNSWHSLEFLHKLKIFARGVRVLIT